jgi:hypothetical protein
VEVGNWRFELCSDKVFIDQLLGVRSLQTVVVLPIV